MTAKQRLENLAMRLEQNAKSDEEEAEYLNQSDDYEDNQLAPHYEYLARYQRELLQEVKIALMSL